MPDPNSLIQIQLQGNALSGSIPNTWATFGTSLGCLILAENPGLCGVVPNGLPCFDITNTNLGEHRVSLSQAVAYDAALQKYYGGTLAAGST